MSQRSKAPTHTHQTRTASIIEATGLPLSPESESFRRFVESAQAVHLSRRRAVASAYGQGGLLIVASGKARVVRPSHERPVTLGYYGPGQVLGIRSVTQSGGFEEIIALEDMELLRIPVEVVLEVSAQEPRLAGYLLQLVSERRFALEVRLEALLTRTVEARVADLISELVEEHGVPHAEGRLVDLRITHNDIAAYVGATRETVTVVLASLRKRGAISFDRRKIVVVDKNALERMSE